MKYFLDANIFMYAAGKEHPLKAPCNTLLTRAARDEFEAVTNTEILQELLYHYGAIGEMQRGVLLTRLAVDQVGGEVLPVTLSDMQHAMDLIGRYGAAIESRDAVHAATMLNHGVTHIITADRHFDVIEGVTRVDPQKAARPGRRGSGSTAGPKS